MADDMPEHYGGDSSGKEVMSLEDSGDEADNIGAGSMVAKLHARTQFIDALAISSGNRMISDDNAEDFLNALTTDADENVCYTYREGKKVPYDESATTIDIAILYVPGADLAEVNILENKEITQEEASQKSARWRALTAGSLLREVEVQRDLKIIRVDKTAAVLAQHKANQRGYKTSNPMADAINRGLMKLDDDKDKVVNINSEKVHILNAFSEQKKVDLECTCIEIDGTSLLNLIYNFRDLLSRQGKFARLSPDETVSILETMIEDARRLLVRSPILTRVAQRIVIQTSHNTRYGFDTGTMFHTFTTSKGIAEIIQQGVGYYSSLQTAKEEQARIRPKFMQMVVFLLSLLNDDDLERLRPALEQSYELKADRKSIELTILKVLTYYAVGSHLFLTGVISAFRMERVSIKDNEDSESQAWDIFLGEAARLGWIMPGLMEDLGRSTGSWKLKWRKFKDSDIFDHLQYCGEKNAVNYIPPLKINSSTLASQEVSAEFRNGQTYQLSAKDLDAITLSIRARYTLLHSETKLQSDLVVKEESLFKEIHQAAADLELICSNVNDHLPFFDEPTQLKRKSRLISPKAFRPKSRDARPYFSIPKPLGHRTKNTTIIVTGEARREEIIAVSWKLDGRKITYKDLLKGVTTDVSVMLNTCESLRDFADLERKRLAENRNEAKRKQIDSLTQAIEIVHQTLRCSDDSRRKMMNIVMDKDDEPIIRVHFPSQIHWKQDLPWCRYTQGYTPDTWLLAVNAERYVVTEQPQWTTNIATLKLGEGQTVKVMPLTEVEDEDRDEEVGRGDTVLLLGGLVAVVEACSGGYQLLNFLKLTSLDRAKRRRRKGGDNEGPVPLQESILI